MGNDGTPYDVVVVGAGQAGLAIGHFLAQQGSNFLILEREQDVGSAWRDRWESLTLFTPRAYDGLPRLDFPGEPDGYPTRDEVVGYLRSYAAQFDLPLRLGTAARRLTQQDGRFLIETSDGQLTADQVVVATGPFQEPRIPEFASALDAGVVQMHSTGYRRPDDLPTGRALVVGGGNTGYQIAAELAATRETHLAIGPRQAALPQRLFGRDLFFFLTKTGLIHKSVDTRIGRRMSQKETLVGPLPKIAKRLGVISHGRATTASGRTVTFADGSQIDVDSVIWATGFRYDHSWIDLPVRDAAGNVEHSRGVTAVPGLYMLGLQWLHTRGSALLGFVGADASYLAEQIGAYRGPPQPAAPEGARPAAATTAAQGD